MAMQLRNALVLFVLSCFSSGLVFTVSAQNHGTATYYTPPYVPSACFGFDVDGTMITSASDALWNDGAACGKRYEVACISGTNQGVRMPCQGSETVTVTIVDRCPPPACRGTIELSQEAFASIADPAAGAINISFQQI